MAVAATAVATAGGEPDIGFPTVAEAFAALSADPELEFREEAGWLSADRREGDILVFWTFTSEVHQAHPSAVKRILLKTTGNWQLEMRVLCEADEAACDELVGEFHALNDQLRRRLSRAATRDEGDADPG